MNKDFKQRLESKRAAIGLPRRAQKTVVLYFGQTHTTNWRKGGNPFVATCANGANAAGKTLFKVDFTNKSASALCRDIVRFEYFVRQLKALQAAKQRTLCAESPDSSQTISNDQLHSNLSLASDQPRAAV